MFFKNIKIEEKKASRKSLVVQWLRLRTSTAGGLGSILGLGTKIQQTACSKKKKNLKIDSGLDLDQENYYEGYD